MEGKQKEILERVSDMLVKGKKEGCEVAVKEALDNGIDAQRILMDGLKSGMDVIGVDYGNHKIFLPNVLCAARVMYAGIDILKPHLKVDGEANAKGTVVIGTVEGDMHDIGKNIVRILLDGMSFNTIDLGRDVPTNKWVEITREHKPDVVGCSTLMSTTLRSIEQVMEALSENNLRANVKTIIGGAATNATFANKIGADGWGADANDGVKKIMHYCEERRH